MDNKDNLIVSLTEQLEIAKSLLSEANRHLELSLPEGSNINDSEISYAITNFLQNTI
jgi:hypothetical protein